MEFVLPIRYIDSIPLLVVFVATILLFLAFNEIGFRIGRRWQEGGRAPSSQTGAIMGAALGLLGFMLAFTFGSATARFDARKKAVLDEANAIGTTWLRSQMLASPYPEQLEPLLLQYVEVRLEGANAESLDQFRDALKQSEALHGQLWERAIALGREEPRSVVIGLFIASLNEVIDLHTTRVTVARQRMPRSVWWTLYFIAFTATMMVGVNAGVAGERSLFMTTLLAVTLAAVLALIIDIDRPGQALFSVSQQALIDLRDSMRQHAAP